MGIFLRFAYRNWGWIIVITSMIWTLESALYIYIFQLIQIATDEYSYFNGSPIFSIGSTFIFIALTTIIRFYLACRANDSASRALTSILTSDVKTIVNETASIKSRAATYIIDIAPEVASWLSLPLRLTVTMYLLTIYGMPLSWPVVTVVVTLFFTYIFSQYKYRLGNAISSITRSRSLIIARLHSRHLQRATLAPSWSQRNAKRVIRSELKIRNKETILEEISQQFSVVTGLVVALFLVSLDIIERQDVLIFVIVTGYLGTLLSEVPTLFGSLGKASSLLSIFHEQTNRFPNEGIWAGSLVSNTLMHNEDERCIDIFKSIFGTEFVEIHHNFVSIEKLSTGQRNVILSVRLAWVNKNISISEKLSSKMDELTRVNLYNALKKHIRNEESQ